MRPITFYATPDATQAIDDMAERWGCSSGQALVRLTERGIPVVEAIQAEYRTEHWHRGPLYDPAPRFAYFDEAGRKGHVSPLPEGARKFPVIFDDVMARRLDRAARRETRPFTSLHGVVGWAIYEALVMAEHPLFPATKVYQRAVIQRG